MATTADQLLPYPDQVPRRAPPALRGMRSREFIMKDAYSFDVDRTA